MIDVFHKIRHLHALGWEIDLHCFTYDRSPASELERYVKSIRYYSRSRNPLLLVSKLPFIVVSRKSQRLFDALNGDENPILIEGLHCTHPLLDSPALQNRTIVRTHNIEHAYYRMLADAELSKLKSAYYRMEAEKLQSHESILTRCHGLAAISETDLQHFKDLNPNSELVFPFHAFDSVSVPSGCGDYSLFHGALHVAENHRTALWLLDEVAPHLDHPLIIAGKGITDSIRKKASTFGHVRLAENPTHEQMDALIRGAQSHLLPAFAQAGMRLKLLHALFHGRHVIANGKMLKGTQLHPYCITAETAVDFIREARSCHRAPMNELTIALRKTLQLSPYSNSANAKKLTEMLESIRK